MIWLGGYWCCGWVSWFLDGFEFGFSGMADLTSDLGLGSGGLLGCLVLRVHNLAGCSACQ